MLPCNGRVVDKLAPFYLETSFIYISTHFIYPSININIYINYQLNYIHNLHTQKTSYMYRVINAAIIKHYDL